MLSNSTINTTTMMMVRMLICGAAEKGFTSSRCSSAALSCSPKALATVSLPILLPTDQVTSFGVCSSESWPLALAKSRLLVFWPRDTGQ